MTDFLVGTLYKRRGGFGKFLTKKWEKRGFILSPEGVLAYFESETPPADHNSTVGIRGSIDLVEIPCTIQGKIEIESSPNNFTIQINPLKGEKVESWKLCSETEEDYDAWFTTLSTFSKVGEIDEGAESDTSNSSQKLRKFRRASTGAMIMSPSCDSNLPSTPSSPSGRSSTREGKKEECVGKHEHTHGLIERRSTEASSAKHEHSHGLIERSSTEASNTNQTTQLAASMTNVSTKKKKTGGLKLKKNGNAQDTYEVLATLLVVNICILSALVTQSTLSCLFYMIVCSVVVWHTLNLRSARVAAAVTAANAASAATIAALKAKKLEQNAENGIDSNKSTGDKLSKQESASLPLGKHVAGATFTQVFTKPPNVPEHTWCKCDASEFNVRVGPNYDRNKKKAPSGAPLYEPYAVDFICTKQRKDNICERVDIGLDTSGIETNNKYVPPIFVVQIQIPSEPPPSMFSTVEDGPGWAAVMYFRITQDTCDQLKDLSTASPAVKLFQKYCEHADSEAFWKTRFKLICSCSNLDEMGLPSMIVSYNAKPMLIRKTGTFFRGKNYCEFDLHVHKFATIAKQSIHMISSRCGQMYMQIGFVIEGRTDDELPETLFGCVAINKPQEERGEFVFEEDVEDDDNE